MFGQTLTELRKQKKLTQEEMAKIIGVARTTYSSYEQGRRTPDVDVQNKIADYFNVSLDYLHGRTDDKEKAPTLVAAHLDDNLTEEQLDEVRNFIDFIKQRDHSGK
ncbi:helix-turn-helix domain-containing protein [Enterococcus sp. 2201sp1_2201st1_B8_2201SCRN_220225]|uniref:helix-turn-helix domain-containing protein n=1 Tax=unclassified Enterococcus TaxID=2608891 RepID=UPI0034A18529